ISVGDASVNQGDQFCVSVTADNFTDLVGMSFTLSYDASRLSFNQATNLNSSLPAFNAGANIGNPSPGFITVNWFEQSLNPITLPNGSV
ncbi:cohesin domain-containing protein, partial [Phaeodactylibacter luteus]